jgi:hypothetical protein
VLPPPRQVGGRADTPFALQVAGVDYRQDALWASVAGSTPGQDGTYEVDTLATLVREPSSSTALHAPSDVPAANAIAVHLSSGHVGYLSAEDAADYAEVLDALGAIGVGVSCNARIIGGARQTGVLADPLSVCLDLDYPDDLLGASSLLAPPSAIEQARVAEAADGPQPDHGIVRGRHYTEHVEVIRTLMQQGAFAEAESLLLEILDAIEHESRATEVAFEPWYYEQIAVMRHLDGDFAGEVAMIERCLGLYSGPIAVRDALTRRLERAKRRMAGR